MQIYTRHGDDGTTGLLYGGRVRKDAGAIEVNGAVDEAQAMLGLARSSASDLPGLDALLTEVERELYCLMAEVATAPENRSKLTEGVSKVTPAMVAELEVRIDELTEQIEMPTEFVIPGQNVLSASLDVARTVVRRAERLAVGLPLEGSEVVAYLNRLSDLVWTMARWAEGDEHVLAKRAAR
jgi:cob(I)alamin adenosyltransferase